MKVNINTLPLVPQQLPNTYAVEIEGVEYTVENYPALTHLHYEHGWRDLIIPEIDHTTEKLGELYFDEANDVVTYEVLEKTREEIEAEFRQNATAQRQIAIQRLNDKKVEEELSKMDDEEAIQNMELFPIWESGISVKKDNRYQCLCDNLHIHLFKCLTDHVTDVNPEQSQKWIKL